MNETREQRRQEILRFLRSIQKAGVPVETLKDSDRLVASGLIDSLAILQIVTHLEDSYGIDFARGGVSPEDLGSIGGILDAIEMGKE